MSAPVFDAESLRKVIEGQRITFSGRRLYLVNSAVTTGEWVMAMLTPGEHYGTYPVDEEAEKAYREWCAANAGDPLVDEVFADRYIMYVFTYVWSLPAAVRVRNLIVRHENPPVVTLEMQPCS
jgi:hypothetical protein